MTLFLVDIASYQHAPDPINLAAAKEKGVNLVNIKTTQGTRYVFTAGRQYADTARSLGMGICTFHYLTGSASGAAQADYAWKQILALGGPQGMAHECDCEADATEAIYRDYVKAMQDKIQRHILTYSGDWWWQPRGWHGADLTPYYTAAPNAGYLGSYPGDTSPHWHAGYGGWDNLSMMQYAVGPISGVGGGDLSKSAIRDPAIWAALTGGGNVITSDNDAQYEIWRVKTMSYLDDKVQGGPETGKTLPFVPAFKQLANDVAALKARPPVQAAPVDPATLKAVLLDPEVLAAIAKAVNDDDHKRSAE